MSESKVTKTQLLGIVITVIVIVYLRFPSFRDALSQFLPKSAPACGDVAVKNLVVDISREELKNQLVSIAALRLFSPFLPGGGALSEALSDKNFTLHFHKDNENTECGKKIEELKFIVLKGQSFSYEQLDEIGKCDASKLFKNLISTHIDEPLANINVLSIRTNAKDNELKKSECKADIAFSNGNTVPIGYTAQITSDGGLYVSVSGLK